jgi:hypothetical protein
MRAQLQFQVAQRAEHFALKLLARKQQLCEFLAAKATSSNLPGFDGPGS